MDRYILSRVIFGGFFIIFGLGLLGGPVAILHYPTGNLYDDTYCKIATHGDSQCFIECYTYDHWYWTFRMTDCYWHHK